MKLSHAMWGHPRLEGHGGDVWQNVVHWRREWQTTSVFLPWEPHEQYEKSIQESTKYAYKLFLFPRVGMIENSSNKFQKAKM